MVVKNNGMVTMLVLFIGLLLGVCLLLGIGNVVSQSMSPLVGQVGQVAATQRSIEQRLNAAKPSTDNTEVIAKLDAIEKYIYIDESKIKKININTCEATDLKNAYIKWNVANAIVNYRKNHGKYKSVDEIKKTDLVDDETYRKIVSYLTLD